VQHSRGIEPPAVLALICDRVRKMKEENEHPGKKLVGRREIVENSDKQGWDGLTGWLKTE